MSRSPMASSVANSLALGTRTQDDDVGGEVPAPQRVNSESILGRLRPTRAAVCVSADEAVVFDAKGHALL